MRFISILLILSFLLASLVAEAGKIYRFLDKDGVSTLSKDLPPYAAQKGYDILDDKSLRLIKRVYTREELLKIKKKQQIAAEKEKEKQRRLKEARQKILKQRVKDRNLLARYPTEEIFIQSRDDDLQYHQKQIQELKKILTVNKKRLEQLQEQAAEAELNGDTISTQLKQDIAEAKKEIVRSREFIQQTQAEYQKLSAQYKKDHARLRELLATIKENRKKSAHQNPAQQP